MPERGDRDVYNNGRCPKCGAMYCADSDGEFGFPVPPETEVVCIGCKHHGPIKKWWDTFDAYSRR